MQAVFDKVEKFLGKPSSLPKIIIIYGPTASGKTALSIELAKVLRTEIISADSRQIYRGMDIWTGKITEAEMQGIPHHMIDIRNPDEIYSVGLYQTEVFPIIKNLHTNNKIPILCGGTGLYLDSVAFHFDMPSMEPDWEFRERMERIRNKEGNEYLWKLLFSLDPAYAGTIHPNAHHAVIRALEVWEQTGKSKQELRVKKDPLFEVLFLTPYDGDREVLYNRINKRIEGMFKMGLIEEVESLLGQWYAPDSVGLSTIGYKEVIEYMNGICTLEDAQSHIQQGNRNYAKRQLTWFRKYEENGEK